MHLRLILILSLLMSVNSYGYQETVYRYSNGKPKYILGYEHDTIISNTFLSEAGDTIYSWDLPQKQIIEFTFLGEYLLPKEYDSLKTQLHLNKHIGNAYLSHPPHTVEWTKMHDRFFHICPVHTRILREGDFTIYLGNRHGVADGVFKKYYKNQLVLDGKYNNGHRTGLWKYYPYYFYPYKDVTVFDVLGKEYSLIYGLPYAAIALLLLFAGFKIAGTTKTFNIYFYSVLVIAVAALLCRLYIPFNRYNVWIKYTIPMLWFTFWHAMILMCTIDLFFIKKTNTRPIVNVICLLFGIGFSIYIILFKHLDF